MFCFAGSIFAQGRAEQDARNARRAEGKETAIDRMAGKESRSNWLYNHKAIVPFIPDDLIAIVVKGSRGPSPYNCADDGVATPIEIKYRYGNCDEYTSAKTNTKWRMRVKGGYIDRAFQVYKDGAVREHVVMDSNVVVSMSSEAAQIASLNGYQLSPKNNTMVAINSGGAGNQQTAQSSPVEKQIPQVAQVPSVDCSKLSGFAAKAQCFANSAAAIGALKKP